MLLNKTGNNEFFEKFAAIESVPIFVVGAFDAIARHDYLGQIDQVV